MIPSILFCLSVGLAASVVVTLDFVTKSKEPYEALWTREVWLLYLCNVLLAGLLTATLYSLKKIKMDFLSWLAIFSGYPFLIHTKIFTIKGESPEKDISIGFEFFYQKVTSLLTPGIERSIEERGSRLLEDFRGMSIETIVERAKDYITPKSLPPDVDKAKLFAWLDEIKADTQRNPQNEDDNKRAIFGKIQEIGGYRGIRYIMKR